MSMQIVNAKPPCYEQAMKAFGFKETDPVYFTYGDKIYDPVGTGLTPDLIVHEETHGEQQDMHPDVAKMWWERYLHDPEFRIEQEAEAYGAQFRFLCRRSKDRNKRARMLHVLARALSGPMYGSACSYADASLKIRTYADNGGAEE